MTLTEGQGGEILNVTTAINMDNITRDCQTKTYASRKQESDTKYAAKKPLNFKRSTLGLLWPKRGPSK